MGVLPAHGSQRGSLHFEGDAQLKDGDGILHDGRILDIQMQAIRFLALDEDANAMFGRDQTARAQARKGLPDHCAADTKLPEQDKLGGHLLAWRILAAGNTLLQQVDNLV